MTTSGSPLSHVPGPSIPIVTDAALTTDHDTLIPEAVAWAHVRLVAAAVRLVTVGPVGAGVVGAGVAGGAAVVGAGLAVVVVTLTVVVEPLFSGIDSVLSTFGSVMLTLWSAVVADDFVELLQPVRPRPMTARTDRAVAVAGLAALIGGVARRYIARRIDRQQFASRNQRGIEVGVAVGVDWVPDRNRHTKEMILGVIHDPMMNETWSVVQGGPPMLNGKPISVSPRETMAEAVVTVGFSKSKSALDAGFERYKRIAYDVRKTRMLGSAALALAYIACGRLDAYVEEQISLWDIAAGVMLVEAAGGKVSTSPSVVKPGTMFICASNGKLPIEPYL